MSTQHELTRMPETREEWDKEVTAYLNWWEAKFRSGASLDKFWKGDDIEWSQNSFTDWVKNNDVGTSWQSQSLHIAMIRERIFHPGIILRTKRWIEPTKIASHLFWHDDTHRFAGNRKYTELDELAPARNALRQYINQVVTLDGSSDE